MKKILIIDDEREFAEGLVKTFLEQTGDYKVRVESSGLNGLRAAKEFAPDLIFLDVMMRDCAGPKVAADIEADQTLQKVPIIFLTATASRAANAKGVYDGQVSGRPFLAKPIQLERFLTCVEKTLK